jgi:hypothetical protein
MNLPQQLRRNQLIGNIASWEKGLVNCQNNMYFGGDSEKNKVEYGKLLKRIAKAKKELAPLNEIHEKEFGKEG